MSDDKKLKSVCSKCGKEYEINLPNDPIFKKFTMICRDCVSNFKEFEEICKNV